MDAVSTGGLPTRGRLAFRREAGSKIWVPHGPLDDTARPYPAASAAVASAVSATNSATTATLATDLPTSQLLVLQFGRSSPPLPPLDLRGLTAVRTAGDGVIGSLSSQFLLLLARHLRGLGPLDTARLVGRTLDVLTAALADALDVRNTVPPHTGRRALSARIHAFIRENLGDPGLTPDTIAAAHHISLRYLHKLFHAEGRTVAAWIRERRLEQCRRDLADPALSERPIRAIAARWGFTSPAHFSQVFRSAHGCSPRQFRHRSTTASGDQAAATLVVNASRSQESAPPRVGSGVNSAASCQ
ncbi:helix-turn-helix domain-containing protein [Streptomyces sp. BH-SS-21]|uniref:Helix-turn-helix domain-containing protein n=1 Tax=Streptomyces liliiviolaceus TaxID=2823109 RepID=A0A940YDH0_9ACTN|nr:helix-turn-helix domain-containing protein [Streptomyces liliiviolaceus]